MNNLQKGITILLKIALAIIFLFASTKMPYKYYEFVRIAGFVGFIIVAFTEYQKSNKTLAVFWLLAAIIINPLKKVVLHKEYWVVIDVALAVVLLVSVFTDVVRTYNATTMTPKSIKAAKAVKLALMEKRGIKPAEKPNQK
jgi:hypothetical protein